MLNISQYSFKEIFESFRFVFVPWAKFIGTKVLDLTKCILDIDFLSSYPEARVSYWVCLNEHWAQLNNIQANQVVLT